MRRGWGVKKVKNSRRGFDHCDTLGLSWDCNVAVTKIRSAFWLP